MAISNLTVSSGSMSVSKVVVIDGNNLIVRIDRGVAGRGVTDVEAVEIDNSLYLVFSFTDGTTETVGPVGTIQYIGQAPIVVNGSTISLSTVPVNLGGTGATTAANARTNLNAANQDTTISAGTGLSGGGSLAANRTLSIANTAVTAAAYGSASKTLTATVNAQGQLTALADTDIAIANTQISGLGTMSTQNATSVAITGGTITGITDLAVADGGTGASDASGARTNLGAAASAITISAGTGLSGGGDLSANRTLSIANTSVTAAAYGSASNTLTATVNAQGQLTALAATPIAIANTQVSGLGTMSTQSANSVSITGGSITGITDLAIADGGTGASNAADARTNLGLGTAAVLNAGVALGVATLDAGGTVPLSQIPASIQGGVSYQGSWNAATNTPTLTSSVGSKGYYYVVSVAGSTNLNGITDWLPGDWAIFNGSVWEQIDNTDTVASVNGYVGAVVLTAADVGAPPTTRTISAGTGLTGGGDLSANRTITLADTTVTAGAYGSASSVPNYTVNAQGQLTAAASTAIAINGNQITSGTVAIANGGSGTNTAQGAMNAFAGAVTSGSYLRGNGTNVVMSSIQAADVPTLNQNTTGTAANVTGIVGTAYGGTGLSSFTANGVVYASSTSALATGSALTFDGTSLVNRVSANATLQLAISATNATNADFNVRIANNLTDLQVSSATPLSFTLGASEKLRLTATSLYTASDVNVGFGTSSPAYKLDVTGTINSGASTATGYNLAFRTSGITTGRAQTSLTNTSGDFYTGIEGSTAGQTITGSAAYSAFAGTFTANPLYFVTNGVIRTTLDSAGNLGLGVTPSDWSSASRPALQLPNGAALFTRSGSTFLSQNFFYNSSDTGTYIANGFATLYNQANGQHQWFNAPSGTANNTAALTQAMTLDASGNLVVGTTNAANARVKVQLVGSATTPIVNVASFGSAGVFSLGGIANNSEQVYFGTGDTAATGIAAGFGFLREASGWNSALAFYTNNQTAGANGVSAITERARIDSSGNLLVGGTVTEASAKQLIRYGSGSNGLTISTPDDINGTDFVTFRANNAVCGFINRVGTTSAVMYTTTSDYRLKTVIGPVANAGQRIDALQPVEYTWNASGERTRGFLAHQFQEVYAGSVSGTKDAVDAEGKPVYQAMQASTSEVIADLVAELKSLRARVAALESA